MKGTKTCLLGGMAILLSASLAHAQEQGPICGYACNQKLKDMAAPIINPTVFEDPRSTTEIRPIFIYHKIGDNFITNGGSATIYAVQARYAITDRLSVIATKDGYVDMKFNDVLDDQNGWANLAGGIKYAVYMDEEARQIATLGFRYEAPTGSPDVFQGEGDGSFNPFVSGAVGVGPINLMGSTGFRIAANNDQSSFYDLSLHADTNFGWFHPNMEFALTTVTNAGDSLPIPDEGADFFNLSAAGANGQSLATLAFGSRFDLAKDVSWGVAYQVPLTHGQGSNIFEYRVTTDIIYKFL